MKLGVGVMCPWTKSAIFEIHQALHLPKNLYFEWEWASVGVMCPATNSALRGSQSSAPATKSALRGSPSAVPATKSAFRGSPGAAFRGSQSTAPATKSANEPQVQKLRFMAPVTKERLEDDHDSDHDQSTTLPRRLHFDAKPLGSLAPITKSRLWTTKTRGFPLRLPRKVTTMSENSRKCARRHNESTVATSARRGHPDFASLRSQNAPREFREA